MIADRNRRQRRKWRRTCGGARRRCVASIGEYVGFDRFGRVIDHRWYVYGASADRARYTYGYDRASNRLYREITLTTGRDELYGYDQLNRLVEFARGDLNNPKSAIENPKSAEDWSLDMTGNWPGFVQKTSGSTDLDQSRTHNPVNEITAITAATGTNWADPVHDRNGNMTTIPKPASLADGLTATYDAWNRLVEVKDGATVIARYEYDGLNRRITSHVDSGAPSNPTGIDTYVHYYHNSAWQILETRQSDTESAQPETLQPKHQYVWSQRYIDELVLRDENTSANGLCDDQRLYYLNDANFNVTALLDTAGDPMERYVYSPYGGVTIYDATWTNTRSASNYANLTLYTGREFDAETGLYYYRNRYYGAELGRFVSRDPIEYRGAAMGLYSYVASSPSNRADPSGKYYVLPGGSWPVDCHRSRDGHIGCICWRSCLFHLRGLQQIAGQCQADAQKWANEAVPPTADNPNPIENQALRHCFAVACLAEKTSIGCAVCIGDERERYQFECEGQGRTDTRRAIRNNQYGGYTCGKTSDFRKCCLEALSAGDLDVTPDPPPNTPGEFRPRPGTIRRRLD